MISVPLGDGSALIVASVIAAFVANTAHMGFHIAFYYGYDAPHAKRNDAIVGYIGAILVFALYLFDSGSLVLPAMLGMRTTLAIGTALVLIGIVIHFSAHIAFRHHRPGKLVQTGIYRYLRHPMYYGWIIALNGGWIAARSTIGCLTAPIWAAEILFCALLEHRKLRSTVPAAQYDAYLRRTLF